MHFVNHRMHLFPLMSRVIPKGLDDKQDFFLAENFKIAIKPDNFANLETCSTSVQTARRRKIAKLFCCEHEKT